MFVFMFPFVADNSCTDPDNTTDHLFGCFSPRSGARGFNPLGLLLVRGIGVLCVKKCNIPFS